MPSRVPRRGKARGAKAGRPRDPGILPPIERSRPFFSPNTLAKRRDLPPRKNPRRLGIESGIMAPMAIIILERSESQQGAEFEIIENGLLARVGRDESNEVPLQDPRASRVHCTLQLKLGTWYLEDQKSRNGTLHRARGERIDTVALSDNDTFKIGSTLLRFIAGQAAVSWLGKEVAGCRLDEHLLSHGGVLGYRAWQLALDRPVRIDFIHPSWAFLGAGEARDRGRLDALLAAFDAADTARGDRSGELLSGDAPTSTGGATVLMKPTGTMHLGDALGALLERPFADRLDFAVELAGALLERGRSPALRSPVGLQGVWLDDDGALRLPPLDLMALVTDLRNAGSHMPGLIPYLPPEKIQSGSPAGGKPAEDPSFAALAYNLGALVFHVLSGEPPMGQGHGAEVLKNHLKLAPTPLDALVPEAPRPLVKLIDSLLAKEPGARPAAPEAIAAALDESRRDVASSHQTVVVGRDSPSTPDPAPGRATADAPRPAAASASRPPAGPRPVRDAGDQPTDRPWWIWLPLWLAFWIVLFLGARLGTVELLKTLLDES